MVGTEKMKPTCTSGGKMLQKRTTRIAREITIINAPRYSKPRKSAPETTAWIDFSVIVLSTLARSREGCGGFARAGLEIAPGEAAGCLVGMGTGGIRSGAIAGLDCGGTAG